MREHLKSRNMQVERYQNLHIDEENNIATFLLFSLSGNIVGFQRYNPKGNKERRNDETQKYFCHFTNEGEENQNKGKKKIGFFGVETLQYREDIVFLTEGVFAAVRFHNMNLPALAVLKNDPKDFLHQIELLKKTRKVVVFFDNDNAGMKLRKYGHDSFTCEGDVDNLTDEQFELVVKNFFEKKK